MQGMVDSGELVSQTLMREFGEEALNSLAVSGAERAELESSLKRFFKGGVLVCP